MSDPIPLDEVLSRMRPALPVTADNLVAVVREAMEVVETYRRATGEQKKATVLACVDSLLRNTDSGAALEAVEPAVLALLPHLVDELVVCSRHSIRVNRRYRARSCRCLCALLRNLVFRACGGSRA